MPDNNGWNWIATIALVMGTITGYISQYVTSFGLRAVQSLIIAGIVYCFAMKIKARNKGNV
ncbi:hypothetical protein [Virgibacillus pantothenticus]|uniref:hypothetical protein n=1 Tax=Virgibacillus pantothenticus TaxID=1473 RepID=UPI00098773B7|nr:hypothetical protein [Virgibacillus pantothenticus]